MDLMSNLSKEFWKQDDISKNKDFQPYTVIRRQMMEEGVFKYAISDTEGNRKLVTLEGATKRDPLKDVANCELRLNEETVTGIHLEGDCVVRI